MDTTPFHNFPHPDGHCEWCDNLSHLNSSGIALKPNEPMFSGADGHNYGGELEIITHVNRHMLRTDIADAYRINSSKYFFYRIPTTSSKEYYREIARLSNVPNLLFQCDYSRQTRCFTGFPTCGRAHVVRTIFCNKFNRTEYMSRCRKFIEKYGDPSGFVTTSDMRVVQLILWI
jgi:hypothetical protein